MGGQRQTLGHNVSNIGVSGCITSVYFTLLNLLPHIVEVGFQMTSPLAVIVILGKLQAGLVVAKELAFGVDCCWFAVRLPTSEIRSTL